MVENKWLILFVALALLCVPVMAAFSGSGAGTSGDPYQITTYNQLKEIDSYKTSYYLLMNDITCTGTWTPIDLSANGATGFQLDGNGYKISNFRVSGSYEYAGFISHADYNPSLKSPTFKNITFYNATVYTSYGGETIDGILVGKTDGAINAVIIDKVLIYDSSVTGYGAGGYHGLFIGASRGGAKITNSAAYRSTVSGGASTTGALTGSLYGDVEAISGSWSNLSQKSIIAVRGGTTTVGTSYWDSDFGSSGYGGTSNTSANMKIQGTYSGWDFTSLWKMSQSGGRFQGYPIFKWISEPVTPVAAFTKSSTGGAAPHTVTFTDTSTNTPTSWFWVFGDGSTTNNTAQNPVHTFSSAGTYNVNLTATNTAGSNTTATQAITVGDAPSASFTKNVTSGTIPFNVAFTSTSTGTATLTYYWVFADGSTSTSTDPVHEFTTAGSYAVNVTVTNSYGTSQSSTQTITSNQIPAPTASFTKDKTSGANPLTVQFTDTSTGAPASWYWVFGDGSSTNSTVQNPVHTFTVAGTYNVNLTATNSGGSNTTATQAITVVDPPTASFTKDKTSGAAPLTVQFTDTSTGIPTSWYWVSSDGWTATTQNAGHDFALGVWTVNLTVSNAYGISTSATQTVDVGNAANASFTKNYQYRTPSQAVHFTDTTLNSPTVWLYVCSDGQTSDLQNPNFTFSTTGTKSCNLTATNTYGASTSPLDYVYVGNAPVSNWIWYPAPPQAVGVSADFVDYNTAFPPYTYGWHMKAPNGTYYYNVSITNPGTVTFDVAGTWRVASQTQNNYGASDVTFYDYLIFTPLTASFTKDKTSGTAPLTVVFTDTSIGTPTSWYWVFGDGSSTNATMQNPVHTFASAGTYNTNLTVTNDYDGDTSATQQIVAGDAPVASFTRSPSAGNAPLTVSFTDTSTNTPTSWSWDFGDGTGSTLQNPTHQYVTAGSYSVQMTALNAYGSGSSGTSGITAYLLPKFSADKINGVEDLLIAFTDESLGGATGWTWTFGDGASSILRNTSHTYTSPGVYDVSLELTRAGATTNTTTKTGYITVVQDAIHDLAWTPEYPDNTVKARPSFGNLSHFYASHTGGDVTTYTWDADGQNTGNSSSAWVQVFSPARTFWVNFSATNSNSTVSYNHTYTVRGVEPKIISFTPSIASGTLLPPTATISFNNAWNSTWNYLPVSYLYDYGDGSAPTSALTHKYTTYGTFSVTVTGTNSWGSDSMTIPYIILTPPAQHPSTMRWTDKNGVTITTAQTGDTIYYAFNTVNKGDNPPYNAPIMDSFYLKMFTLDKTTGMWINQTESRVAVIQKFGSFSPNPPITFIPNVMPYGGFNWTGTSELNPTVATTYRMYLMGYNSTYMSTYDFGHADVVVSGVPVDIGKTGDWASGIGGDAAKLIIAVIVMIGAIALPFAIMKEFNPYIETISAILGIGLCYYTGLVPLWVIFALGIIGAIAIFFMSRSGGTSGGGEEMG